MQNFNDAEISKGKEILEKCKNKFMKSAQYYKKDDNNSLDYEMLKNDKQWHENLVKYYNCLIDESISKCGNVIPYIQNQIAYDLQWIFNFDISSINLSTIIGEQEKDIFINQIKNILQKVQDDIIIEQKDIYVGHKILMLNLKYGKNILEELTMKKPHVYYNDMHLTNLKNKSVFKIIIMEIQNDELVLEGLVQCILPKSDYKIYVEYDNKKRKEIELIPFTIKDKVSIFGKVTNLQRYKIKIPLKKVKRFKFILQYKENAEIKLNADFEKFAKLNDLEESYYFKNGYIVKQKNSTILIKKCSKKSQLKHEWKYIRSLLKIKEYKIAWYRIMYLIHSINHKPIWLVSDRTHRANDNGMHLFKYIAKIEKNAKVYFVIDKKSKDYKEMKKYGKVIKYNSFKYKLYFLLASKIISSQANEWVINAFEDKKEYVKDLYNFDFIFLQHGITKDNISKWINKFRKNIKLFVTCATDEYNSIVNDEDEYIYTKEEVKLLGFPRFDKLTSNSQNRIVFMPTWRKKITESMKVKDNSSEREYSPCFKDTDYFKFFNKLINDERIVEVLKQKGYKGKFYIHPNLEQQAIDFKSNEYIEVSTEITNYNKEFVENNLLITDFSSVAFDFAYLKKPVIYTQFDQETFFSEQLYDKGYFDYDRDGFGPVCNDYESSVNEIVKYIQNDCKLEEKYLERINKFYTFFDKNNCKRVYEEILKM